MALEKYNKKRSFAKTPEPEGRVGRARTGALTFVVQKHDASHLHYDFRLELDGVLKSWAVPKGPSMRVGDKRLAMMTEDHPLSYATFEGEIPAGQYGAGDVIVWDRGVYSAPNTADVTKSRRELKAGLFKGELKFVLYGEKLKGGFALVKMKERGENAWLLIKERDAYASEDDITADVSSVLSRRVLPRDAKSATPAKKVSKPVKRKTKARKKDAMPRNIHPMLATLVEKPFDGKGWLFEIKWDGYRAVAEVKGDDVRLYSRNGKSFSTIYTPVVDALRSIGHDCVLDGEIIAEKNGRADFHTLQQYQLKPVPLQYMVFDLLYLDGEDLRSRPLTERKALLASILSTGSLVTLSEYIEDDGTKLFASVKKRGIEGIIAKRADSPYLPGKRTDMWQKIKAIEEQEAIIVGFTAPRGTRKRLGALVLGAHDKGQLRYIGHSGGGFTERELEDLYVRLVKDRTTKAPFNEKIPLNSPVTWVKPRYVCEIKFTEWTPDFRMRHPIYVGLRADKSPSEVVIERPSTQSSQRVAAKKKTTATQQFTNTEKIYWPEEGYTKGDLLDYYDRMSDIILPYLKDRPENLNRHPSGITGTNFYQKNITSTLPSFVQTVEIWSESNQAYNNYIVCNNKETLLYLVNLGCIELNPWNSRTGSLEQPDYLILDLDPNGRPFSDVITVAKEVKRVLDSACEHHYVKTSGKSGLHIVVPLGKGYRYEDAKNFAELIMRLVHARLPDSTSLERTPKKRGGKMYLDFLQNRFGQTLACAYSVRPHPGATVSTPLEWKEVRAGLDPAAFTIHTIAARLKKKGDLWKDTVSKGVDLREAIRCLQEHLLV